MREKVMNVAKIKIENEDHSFLPPPQNFWL